MNKLKVAIIGSGPSGLAAANKLVQNGFSVTVFDKLSEFGGMLAYGIPKFRIPLNLVQKRIEDSKKLGVVFERKKVDSVTNLFTRENFDLAVIAIGAGNGTNAGFTNEKSLFVIDALDFLLNDKLNDKKMIDKGQVVGVIGGGNSAVDAARVAKKQGVDVKLIYRRTENEMPALKREVSEAKKELVEFDFLLAPKELIMDDKNLIENNKCKLICSVMKMGEMDSTGRRKPIDSGEIKEFIFDKVIVAVGQKNDFDWLEKEGIKTNGKIILVNENYLTSIEYVYAVGDAVTGAKTIGDAVLAGTKCAESIILKYKQNKF